MTNLFENAKFGDIYLSNDGKKNVFCSFTTSGNDDLARLYREGWGVIVSNLDGTVHSGTELGKGIDFTIKERRDSLIDKACEWLKSYRQETPDGFGYIAGIVNDKTIEEFRKAMEKEP